MKYMERALERKFLHMSSFFKAKNLQILTGVRSKSMSCLTR